MITEDADRPCPLAAFMVRRLDSSRRKCGVARPIKARPCAARRYDALNGRLTRADVNDARDVVKAVKDRGERQLEES